MVTPNYTKKRKTSSSTASFASCPSTCTAYNFIIINWQAEQEVKKDFWRLSKCFYFDKNVKKLNRHRDVRHILLFFLRLHFTNRPTCFHKWAQLYVLQPAVTTTGTAITITRKMGVAWTLPSLSLIRSHLKPLLHLFGSHLLKSHSTWTPPCSFSSTTFEQPSSVSGHNFSKWFVPLTSQNEEC